MSIIKISKYKKLLGLYIKNSYYFAKYYSFSTTSTFICARLVEGKRKTSIIVSKFSYEMMHFHKRHTTESRIAEVTRITNTIREPTDIPSYYSTNNYKTSIYVYFMS